MPAWTPSGRQVDDRGLVHVWSTRHRSRAVRNGLQRSPAVGRSRRLQVRSCGNRLGGRTLIRMRSQVQVLAGPPLFSQLRGLTRPTRSRSLPVWAAVGPHASAPVEPRTLPERATPGPKATTPRPRGRRRRPAQVMVGLMPPSMALTTRGAMPRMGCTARGRCSLTDGRSWRATGVSLAGQVVEPGPLPERLPRRRPGPARRRRWPRTARAGSAAPARARAAARAVRGYGRAARPRPSWPCGRPPRRRADAKSPGADTGDTDAERADTNAGRRTSTPGHWTPGHWTPDAWTSHARTPDTGHRTPDTWTLTEDADRATKARQAPDSWAPR
jgi:hypothetical protein